MNNGKSIILSTAYLPPVNYFAIIASGVDIKIEKFENYQKQSYRNRCHIYSANGLLSLNIPVVREGSIHNPVSGTRIDYSENWQIKHWRAIESAYKSSPYFDYYRDEFYPLISEHKSEYLFDYNLELINILIKLTGIDSSIGVTERFVKDYGEYDFRDSFHPKRREIETKNGQYLQVFAHKYGFIDNLSIIDLLFNKGPETKEYLLLKLEA